MASGPAPGSHLTRVPDSERSLTLEVPAPKGSKATAVQKKKWAERTIVAMSKYDGFDMIRQEMAAQELAEMAASGDEGRAAVVEAGAIGPLVHLLGRGTALAKRWAAAALCAIAELRERNRVRHRGSTSDVQSDRRARERARAPDRPLALRRPARPGAGGGGAGGAVVSGRRGHQQARCGGRAPGAGFASSTRQRSRQGRCGDVGVLLCCRRQHCGQCGYLEGGRDRAAGRAAGR